MTKAEQLQAFKVELDALCAKHKVYLTPSVTVEARVVEEPEELIPET